MYSDLYQLGYTVIPQTVGGDDAGKPLVAYKDKHYTVEDAREWEEKFHDANIALVCGSNGVAAIDVDCTHPQLSNSLRKAIRDKWPNMPVRLCNDPKFVIVFRKGDSLLPVKNGHSDVYRGDGGTQQIEYAGHNSPLTIFGTHRKPPHNSYRWGRGNRSLMSTPVHELPVLELSDIEWVFKVFNKNIPNKRPDWVLAGQTKFTRHRPSAPVSDDPFDQVRLGPVYSDSEVDSWLNMYDGSSYKQWNEAGRALHAQYNGGRKGLVKWDSWSKGHDGYEEDACADAWAHFDVGGGTTVATLEKAVHEETDRQKDDLIQMMLDRYVLIEDGLLVGDTQRTTAEAVRKLAEFRVIMASKRYKHIKADGSVTYIPAVKAWLDHAARQDCMGSTFMPCRDRVIEDIGNGQPGKYWNMYVSPEHDEVEHLDPRMINVFKSHINYIFDGPGDAGWILDWLADMVQRPLERPTVTPLHINNTQGTGRGWVTELISQLVGRQNTGETKLDKIADATAKDDYMDNTLVVFIHEIKPMDSTKMYKMYDALKTKLTESYMNLDIKYGSNGMRRVYARFMLMSNNLTCLPIKDDDRRLRVMDSDAVPRSEEYYDVLYKALGSKAFMDNVFTYLKRRKYKASRMTVLEHTPARARIIARTRSATAAALFSAKARLDGLPFTRDMLSGYITTHMSMHGIGAMELNDNELKHLLLENVTSGIILQLDGGVSVAAQTFNGSKYIPVQESIQAKLKQAEEKLQWN